MIDGNNTDYNHFWGLYSFMSTSLKFELLTIRNKTSGPKNSQSTSCDCTTFYLIVMPFNTFANRADPDQVAFVRAG